MTHPPMPVPGPPNPPHTPTPAQYTMGAVLRDPSSLAAAVRTTWDSPDHTREWAVATVNYGGYYASWDDVSTWTEVTVGFFTGEGSLSATVQVVPGVAADLGGEGTLSATVTAQ